MHFSFHLYFLDLGIFSIVFDPSRRFHQFCPWLVGFNLKSGKSNCPEIWHLLPVESNFKIPPEIEKTLTLFKRFCPGSYKLFKIHWLRKFATVWYHFRSKLCQNWQIPLIGSMWYQPFFGRDSYVMSLAAFLRH